MKGIVLRRNESIASSRRFKPSLCVCVCSGMTFLQNQHAEPALRSLSRTTTLGASAPKKRPSAVAALPASHLGAVKDLSAYDDLLNTLGASTPLPRPFLASHSPCSALTVWARPCAAQKRTLDPLAATAVESSANQAPAATPAPKARQRQRARFERRAQRNRRCPRTCPGASVSSGRRACCERAVTTTAAQARRQSRSGWRSDSTHCV